MLIEIRIGPGKQVLKQQIGKFRSVCRFPRKTHCVPHLTLYGPFRVSRDRIQQIIKTIVEIGNEYSFLPFQVRGFKWAQGPKGKVVYFNVMPSNEMKDVRRKLVKEVSKIAPSPHHWDSKDHDFLFHITLAYRLTDREFKKAWSWAQMQKFVFSSYGIRITLLNNQGRIICEYDMLQKKILSRRESLSSAWVRDVELLKTIEKAVPI